MVHLMKVTFNWFDAHRFNVSQTLYGVYKEEAIDGMKTVDLQMATANDEEGLMTCGVCLYRYDDIDRKPKFLQCAHTVCLLCLKEICEGNLLMACPFCHKSSFVLNVEKIPNNPYALHMLKFNLEYKKEPPKPIEITNNPLSISWCLTCGSAKKPGCAGHSSVDMTADAIRSLEGLLKLKEELLKMKDTGTNKLAMAIEERRKVHEQLSLILKAIQCSEEEIKKLQDENNYQLIKMVSVMEKSGAKSGAQVVYSREKFFFSELMSLVEGSTMEDTGETLKQKMEKSIELYEKSLRESMAIASEYELREKVKIAVHLFDENDRPIPTVSWLENGFRFQPFCPSLKGSQARQDSLLVSHAVFSLLQRQKIQLKGKEPAASVMGELSRINAALKSEQKTSPSYPCQTAVSLPPTVRPINKFVLDNLSVFNLRMFQSGHLKGEIVIRPVLTFEHCDFMQKLGEFCFHSQKVVCNKIDKAIAGVYVSFAMSNAQFQPVVSSVKSLNVTQLANQIDEIGVALKTSSNKVIGWSFVLPLENFQNQKYSVHVRNISSNQLFGRVISHQMMECVSKLSLTSQSGREGYTVTLESQSPL